MDIPRSWYTVLFVFQYGLIYIDGALSNEIPGMLKEG